MTLREHQRGAEKAKQNHDAYTSWASAKINEFRKNEKKASLNEASKEKRDENLAVLSISYFISFLPLITKPFM